MNALFRNGFLWTCHHVGLDSTNGTYSGGVSGSSVNRSAVQWLKLQTNAAGDPLTRADHKWSWDRH
jgi:hypothetical protein